MSDRPLRRLAAIVAADVAAYSRLVGEDEEGTLAGLRACRRELIEPLLHEHGGRIANTAGDSLLLEFQSVVNAVRCALSMQRAMQQQNSGMPQERRLEFRVGINVGDVVSEGDDLLGNGVNVAARLEGLAVPGGIMISDDAYRQVRDRVDVTWEDAGERDLKNIARPVRVWHWSPLPSGRQPQAPATSNGDPALSDKPSIAILPFNNLSGDQEQEYFADGITEDIIAELSRIPEILVIARSSAFTYKHKAAKIGDVCRDLGVQYVLEGSVRKAGHRVRINAQLIDGRTDGHLWTERYDRDLNDIFAVQDDVTEKIVRALEVELAKDTAPDQSRVQTEIPEAYDCVLRGREQYRLFSQDGNALARELYEQALALDPGYAEPYAGLAETYVQDWFMGVERTLDRAFELARQAVARDPNLPLAREALSTVQLFNQHHAEAAATARKWIDLEPGNAEAYATLAGAMHFSGENEQVITLIEKATRLNPVYPFFYPHYVGLAQFGLRRFDDAIVAFRRAIARNPDALWPHVFLAVCLGQLDKGSESREQFDEIMRINPEFSISDLPRLLPYKRGEDLDELVIGLRKVGLPA